MRRTAAACCDFCNSEGPGAGLLHPVIANACDVDIGGSEDYAII